jgi:hypothetical protein
MLMFLPSTKPASFSPYDRLPSLAAELVGRNVAAIYAMTSHRHLLWRPSKNPGLTGSFQGRGPFGPFWLPMSDRHLIVTTGLGVLAARVRTRNDRPSQGR